MTADLVAFLRARLDEDERAALNAPPGPWHYDRKRFAVTCDGYPVASWRHEGKLTDGSPLLDRTGEYMERFDPARVLAEVDAKRQMIDECAVTISQGLSVGLAETMLAMLALPYADHPAYREEWRP